jgi:uncharacterized protein YegP (UPF0339 family)
MAHPQFRLFRGNRGQYYFNLTAKNGQVVLTSEGYGAKAGATNGIKSVKANSNKANSKRATLFERKTAKNGKYYFVLTSPNGQTIGKSQMYASTSGRANGIRSVSANAGRARIVDEA